MQITQSEVQRFLIYNPLTGEFTWRVTVRHKEAGTPAGHVQRSGIKQIGINGKSYNASKLAWLYVHGAWPTKLKHKDGNLGNNAIKNLAKPSPKPKAA